MGAGDLPSRPSRLAGWLILAAMAAAAPCVRAVGQTGVTQPIPVVNTGGHNAPVRALVFAPPEGAQLLSAGLDKVVQVWNLRDDPPGLARTVRPRIGRGYAGAIYAMALATVPGPGGQRLLATAGFGVQNHRGEINLFRYPGAAGATTGDVAGELPGGAPAGHTSTVMSLAFDPRGRFLASASMDGTVRLWDLNTRTSVALFGHTGPVNVVAYLPGGRRLVSAGADGLVILWDADRRVPLATARPDPNLRRGFGPADDAINAMAVSPDGRWVVVGRENGILLRYDAANLGNPAVLPRGTATQGQIEALAMSHDGRSLAVSAVSFERINNQRPRVECDIELRSMPDGAVRTRLARTTNLAYACAFSPDDRRLAFAGGDRQEITIAELEAPNRPLLELAGQGSSLWDVGFSADSRAIGFARRRPDLADPPTSYEDFDLERNRLAPFMPGELSRAVTTWNGWTVRPVTAHLLDVLDAQNRGYRLELDPLLDRRWWSYSFLPPGPAHPRPVLALGCESGVAIYRLDDGRRTRLFAGHNGPVYALAPSPDGRWLVTGSSDQTVRLWRLADCDTRAPLGARFAPAGPGQARAKVLSVERFGFAETMGMEPGDEIVEFYLGGRLQTDLAALEPVPPNTRIDFLVERRGQRVLYNTTKRDPPALSLFPALDGEWVVWTPQGYYETSVLGDRRYLGWHRNRAAAGQPTDYFSFDHFEAQLRRGAALRTLLASADRAAFAAAAAALVPQPAPAPAAAPAPAPPLPPPVAARVRGPDQLLAEDVLPRVAILAPERPALAALVVPAGALPVRVRTRAEDPIAGRGLISRIQVRIDGASAAEAVVAPPVGEAERTLSVRIGAGSHRLSVTAWNDRGQERTEIFDVIAQEPQPPPAEVATGPPPQLVVLAIGAGAFPGDVARLPAIPFADEDARDLGAFLAAPPGATRYARVATQALIGTEATSARISQALDALEERRHNQKLAPGDAVFVLVESHFVSFETAGALLGSDARGLPPDPKVPAGLLADCLGRLADYGCKVVLLVDALHERRPDPRQTDRVLIDWARSLYRKNVITFVASIHGPSQRLTARGHGAFAQGVLDSLNVRGQARLAGSAATATRDSHPVTLFEFQDSVTRNVLALTNRQQHARCYVPETIPSKVPLFDPPVRRSLKEPQAAAE